ncbi:MAG: DNA mismatch repair protein MutS, partial [Bacteroidales bacterium]|nr:DNA mismatch repair protein MutS [Bacteroidales bacterium]
MLEQRENNFLAALHLTDKQSGIAFLDISTGEFYLAEGNDEYLDKLFQNFKPMELVIQKGKTQAFKQRFGEKMLLTQLDDWVFKTDYTRELLTKHFHTKSLKGFGVEDLPLGIIAAGAALHYIYETQNHKIQHITKISRIEEDRFVWLDKFTIRNLELIHSPNENAVTLLDVLDQTQTPMGSRMLRKWILMPLKEKVLIDERLSVVEYLINNQEFTTQLTEIFKPMGDMERMVSKIATGKINPREALQLAVSLRATEQLKALCESAQSPILKDISDKLNPCANIAKRIEKEICEEPPVVPSKGGIFRRGVNAELDELTDLATNSRGILADIQQREAAKTGINSLKIGFNNVFGYYLEVTNTYKSKVPAEWTRKQTLTGSERYITEELKELETKILGAQEKILEIEVRLYNELVVSLADYIPIIQNNARLAARLDVLNAFAYCAVQYQYTKPVISNFQSIDIKEGRHPVIERQLPPEEPYIANDIHLDTDKQQIIIITGPNMSGKSALLRQTALITLMAQMGCYVPARECTIG